MTSFERIATLLKSTGVYPMDGTTLIDAEMESYATVMQSLFDEVAAIESAIYFDNVESAYFESYERLFGFPITPTLISGVDLTVRAEKVEAMKWRLAINGDCFDAEGMADALKSFGITASFTETSSGVTVAVTENKDYLATDDEIVKTIGNLFPCGVTVTVTGL